MTPAIVHVAGFSSGYGGNFIASLAQLREVCRRQGWGFVAVFPDSARQKPWCAKLMAEHWRVRFLPRNASRMRCAWALAGIVSQEHARIIHSHFVQYDLSACLAAGLSSKGDRRVRVVWHIHSELNAPLTLVRRLTNFIKYRLLGRLAWMIPAAESVARGALAAGCPPSRVRVVANGIDLFCWPWELERTSA